MKKLLSVLLAVSLALGLTPALASETMPLVADPDNEEHLTFWHDNTSWCLNDGPEEMWLWDEIEQITGVRVDWTSVDDAAWNQQVNLAIASDDMPDVFWHSVGDQTVTQYIGQDIFLPTEDLIAEYMPNLSAILAEHPEYAALSTYSDGHMYGFPYIEELDGGTLYPGPFYINQDWLDELGLAVPTTVDEFVACLKAFRDGGDLNGNGLADEVPYAVNFVTDDALSSQNTFFQFLGCFGESGSYGQSYPYTKIKDGQVFFVADTEAFKNCLEFFHTLYSENLLDIVGISSGDISYNVNGEYATAGALGIWNLYAYPQYEAYTALPRLTGESGSMGYALNRSELNTKSVGLITTACDNPELVAKLFDFFYDPVVSCYINWGPAYYYTDTMQLASQLIPDEEKTTLVTPRYREAHRSKEYDDLDDGYYRWSMTPGPGPCAILSEYYGNVYAWSTANNWNLVDQVTNGKYEVLAENTATPPFSLESNDNATYSMIAPEITNIVKAYMVSAIMDGDVEGTWNDYLTQLSNAGLSDMLAVLNRGYASYQEVYQQYAAQSSADGESGVEAMIEKTHIEEPSFLTEYANANY